MINFKTLRCRAVPLLLFLSLAFNLTFSASADERTYPNLPETNVEYLSIKSPMGQPDEYDFFTKDANIARYVLRYLNSLPTLSEEDTLVPMGHGPELEFICNNKLYLYSVYPIKTLCLTFVGVNVEGVFSVSDGDRIAFTELIRGLSNGTLHIDGFRDEPSEWAKEDIDFLIQNDMLEKKHRFCYDSSVTRLEFCEMVSTLEKDAENTAPDIFFEDTENAKVNFLHGRGVVFGTDETHFSPYSYLTREQVAVIFSRLLSLHIQPQKEKGFEETCFSDMDDVSEWALPSVKLLTKSDIMKGYDDMRFHPKKKITKEEAIVMIARMYRFLNT